MITAHVVYATITGNNEDIADIVTEAFEDAGVDVKETEISQTNPAVFEDVDICVVCPYTYDEGALPEEGMDFYDNLSELNLKGKVYGVAGSGDVFTRSFTTPRLTSLKQHLKKPVPPKVQTALKLIWNLMKTTSRSLINLQPT